MTHVRSPGMQYAARMAAQHRLLSLTCIVTGLWLGCGPSSPPSAGIPRFDPPVEDEVPTIRVAGRVVDSSSLALGGMQVQVNNGAWVGTDDLGQFTVTNVRPPYSLRVRDPVATNRREDQLWLDLTTTAPVVLAGDAAPSSLENNRYEIKVAWEDGSDSGVPAGAEPVTMVFAFTAEVSITHFAAPVTGETGETVVALYWPSPPTGPMQVYVLQGYIQDKLEGTYVRTLFTYQRIGHVSVDSSVALWPLNAGTVSLSPMTTLFVPVEVKAGPWLDHTLGAFAVHLPGYAPLRLFGDGSSSRSFTLQAPDIPGASLSFDGWAYEEREDGNPDPTIRFGDVPYDGTGTLELGFNAPPTAVEPGRDVPFTGRFKFAREVPGPCRITLSQETGGAIQIHTERRELTAEFLEQLGVDAEDRGYWDAECPDGFESLESAMNDLSRYRAALEGEPGQRMGYFGTIYY